MMATFLAISTCALVYSQVGVKVYQFRPLGELGFAMNKKLSSEILFLPEFNNKVRLRFGFSRVALKPRLTTFPTYTIISGDGVGDIISGTGNIAILPGAKTYTKYNIFWISSGVDWRLIDSEKIQVYSGADVLAGGLTENYELITEALSEVSYSGADILGGIRLRLGVEYLINKVGIFVEAEGSSYLINHRGFFSNHALGFGLRHQFLN